MTVAKIHGAEFPIRKIFSNDFNFTIPLYHRPYPNPDQAPLLASVAGVGPGGG